jgi:transcriptional regulator with XRE-family HTH domain
MIEMRSQDFKRWRKSLDLSQKEAAEALGLKRRVVQYYEKGERNGEEVKIPKYVRLACFALARGVEDYGGPADAAEDAKKKPKRSPAPAPAETPPDDEAAAAPATAAAAGTASRKPKDLKGAKPGKAKEKTAAKDKDRGKKKKKAKAA